VDIESLLRGLALELASIEGMPGVDGIENSCLASDLRSSGELRIENSCGAVLKVQINLSYAIRFAEMEVSTEGVEVVFPVLVAMVLSLYTNQSRNALARLLG